MPRSKPNGTDPASRRTCAGRSNTPPRLSAEYSIARKHGTKHLVPQAQSNPVVRNEGLAAAFYLAPRALAFGLFSLCNIYFSSHAFSRHANDDSVSPPLWDVFHSRLPVWDTLDPHSPAYGVPDRCAMLIMAAFATLTARQGASKAARILGEWIICHAILQCMRTILVNVTTLPAPLPACRGIASPPSWGGVPIYCNDLCAVRSEPGTESPCQPEFPSLPSH